MTLGLALAAVVLAYLSYALGRYRGFERGYFAALFDLSIGEPEEYVEALVEDGEVEEAYLRIFGDRIDAGKKGRN